MRGGRKKHSLRENSRGGKAKAVRGQRFTIATTEFIAWAKETSAGGRPRRPRQKQAAVMVMVVSKAAAGKRREHD